jgi:hypothetical protein
MLPDNIELLRVAVVGERIRFDEDFVHYKIIARNERYLVCVKGTPGVSLVFYTIVDLDAKKRTKRGMFAEDFPVEERKLRAAQFLYVAANALLDRLTHSYPDYDFRPERLPLVVKEVFLYKESLHVKRSKMKVTDDIAKTAIEANKGLKSFGLI